MKQLILNAILIICFWFPKNVSSQDSVKFYKNTISISGGLNYFVNNLELYKDRIHPVNFSIYGKWYWQSRYRVFMGIEAGFVQFYSSDKYEDYPDLVVMKKGIPIQFYIGMKFYKGFYGSLGLGPSIIIIQSHGGGYQTLNAVSFSEADFATSLGYRWNLAHRLTLGIEGKFYFSSTSKDINFAFPIEVGYRF